ncbi:MAG TPA: peptidoglycan editing factor PgeF [Syntrophales bacterium]|nr:peptidoglycan editing factor PgeF [Syntrophales bacterium]
MEYLEALALTDCNFLTHAFCTRKGGVSRGRFENLNVSVKEGDAEENVRANLRIIADAFGITVEQFVIVSQVHGEEILTVDRPPADLASSVRLEFDAIVTDQPGVAICVKTADCVPIFFADRKRKVVGVAHAGWRGTALSVAGKTTQALISRFNCRAGDIIAAIGPAIGPCCYKVDEPVVNAMKGQRGSESFFSKGAKPGEWMLDLAGANRMQIMGCGIPEMNTHVARSCTSCRRDMFFSHRGEGGNTGRQLNFIMLNR